MAAKSQQRTVEHRNVRGKTDGQERDSFVETRDATNRRKPRTYRNANVTKAQIEAALAIDPNAMVEVNKHGVVKMLIYTRKEV
jgi:hypothetical protein